ncbi:MAG: DUF2516 family protein [Spirochaetaceae bacterium]|nr:DUF2516 family protein [Spirochaetaceae bacterium]
MDILGPVQGFVLLVLGIGAFVLTGFAVFDALRRKGALFPHVGRLTKPVWLGILAAAFLISIVSLGSPSALGILNVIGVVAAGVYLAEVRPKLRQIDGGGNSGYGRY